MAFDDHALPIPDMGAQGRPANDRLAPAYAACFGTPEGQCVLAHLRSITRDRVLAPQASDAELRHVEGQRALVRHIETLAARGQRSA